MEFLIIKVSLNLTVIEKNPIYGYAYVKAFLDNEKAQPQIQPGQCRLVTHNLPSDINLHQDEFNLLRQKGSNTKHLYYYWSVINEENIEAYERQYNDSYKLKYTGMLQALKEYN